MFKPLIDSYSAVLKKFKGKDIGATINEEVNIERLKTMYDGYDGDRVIEIRFIDPRRFTVQQRNFIYALIGDIFIDTGMPTDFWKEFFYFRFEGVTGRKISLKDESNTTVSDANVLANIILAVPATITVQMQDYFISQIKKYYDNPALKPDGSTEDQNHDDKVSASTPTHQGNAYGKLDIFKKVSDKAVRVAGWLVPDKPQGAIGTYAYVLVMEHGTSKELTRIQSQGIARPDVKKAYGYQGGDALGFDVTFDSSWMKGKKIDIILRRCNQSNGEGAVNDVRDSDIYLTL